MDTEVTGLIDESATLAPAIVQNGDGDAAGVAPIAAQPHRGA